MMNPNATPEPATRRLGSDREAAKVLGVGERKFAQLVADADWLPIPIQLGPRLRRWDLQALVEAACSRAPRAPSRAPEPAPLAAARRARIERMKTGSETASS